MSEVFEYRLTVGESAIDGLGPVNNIEYVRWMQDAAVAHSAALGWPPERYLDQGYAWLVRSHAIKYIQSAHAGDEVIVQTWVVDMRRFSSNRKYRMFRAVDGEPVAKAETQWIFVDLNSQRLMPVPTEVVADFPVFGANDPAPPSLLDKSR